MLVTDVMILLGLWLLMVIPSIYILSKSRLKNPKAAIGFGWLSAIICPPIALLFLLLLTLKEPVKGA